MMRLITAKRFREESGYTLIEVLASIIIFTLAILPMAAMFNAGINSATASSNYDKARSLANLKLEQAKTLPFADVESNFPQAGNTTPFDSAWLTEPGADFANFRYRVEKDYMQEWDPTNQDASRGFATSGPPTDLIRVTVTVQWSNGGSTNTYRTLGLVAK